MLNVAGRKALVTGGSLGIGRATVKIFTEHNIETVFTFNRHGEEANLLASETGAVALRADFSSPEGCSRLVEEVKKTEKMPEFLIHNAGIWTYGAMGNLPYQTWRETMQVNLDAAALLTNALTPAMIKNGFGNIVFVTSTAARRGEAYHSHYAASKGALISFTRSLAVELGPRGIRVNTVAPGWVDTPMSAGELTKPGRREEIERTIPLRRIPPPEEIAYPILFFVSDWARHINGAVLDVNGGAVLLGG